MPFLNLFYHRRGLSGEQIGFLTTITAAVSLVMAPVSSMISGQTEHPQRVLQIGLLSSGTLMIALSQQSAFVWFLVLVVAKAVLASGIWPISAAVAVEETRKKERAGYGSVRLWGSLGWAIIAYAAGWLIERTGVVSAFVGYSISMGLAALILEGIKRRDVIQETEGVKAPPWKGLHSLLQDQALVGLGFAVMLSWLSLLGVRQFEALYMDRLGAPESMIGLASAIGAAVESPVMLWVDALIKKFNATWALKGAFILDAVRIGLVMISPSIPAIMVNRVIGGASFAFYTVAMVVFISERANEKQNAMLQAVYSVSIPRMVSIFGAPLMGHWYDLRGAYIFYPIGFVGIVLSLVVFLLTVSGRRNQQRKRYV